MNGLLGNTLMILVIINPVNLIFLVMLLSKDFKFKDIKRLVLESNIVAMAMLMLFAVFGTFILKSIFHIDVNALRIAGGIILAVIGKNQLEKGRTFTVEKEEELKHIAATPIGIPLIAGPGAITTVITLSHINMSVTLMATAIAIVINCIIMLFGLGIGKKLKDLRLLGALIRIIGLFIMSIGVQMVVTGVKMLFFV